MALNPEIAGDGAAPSFQNPTTAAVEVEDPAERARAAREIVEGREVPGNWMLQDGSVDTEAVKAAAKGSVENMLAAMEQQAPEGQKYGMRVSGFTGPGQTQFFATEEELRAAAAEHAQNNDYKAHHVAVAEYGEDGKITDSNIVFGAQNTQNALEGIGNASAGQGVMAQMGQYHSASWEQAEARLAQWNSMSPQDQERVMQANMAGAGITGDHLIAAGGAEAAIAASRNGTLNQVLAQGPQQSAPGAGPEVIDVGSAAAPAAASGMPPIPGGMPQLAAADVGGDVAPPLPTPAVAGPPSQAAAPARY